MADLSYIQATDEVKIIGQNSTGVGTNTVNADTNGNLQVKDYADGVTGSAVPPNAALVGGKDTNGNLQALTVTTGGLLQVAASDGTGNASIFPAGFLRITDEPTQLLVDTFDTTLDTTNRWTAGSVGGGVAPSVTTGTLTLGTGTTANGYSLLQSKPSFAPTIPGWVGTSFAILLESSPTANAYRFFGAGTTPGTPTAAAPLTNAVGFELATNGKLYAVVYAGGTRMQVADLSSTGSNKQPLDGGYHRYIIMARSDKTFFYLDGLDVGSLVATANFVAPQVQTLPVVMLAVANSSAPGSSGVITCTGLAVWDSAKNNHTLSDGTYAWNKATVKPASTAPLATDTALVVSMSPNSPSTQVMGNLARSGTITTAQQPLLMGGSNAGLAQYLQLSNDGAITSAPAPYYNSALFGGNLTASGSTQLNTIGNGDLNITINVKGSITGTNPVLTVTVSDIDPADLSTVLASSTTTGPSITALGTYSFVHKSRSNVVNVIWTLTGTTPHFTSVYIYTTGKMQDGTLDVTGGPATLGALNAALQVNLAGRLGAAFTVTSAATLLGTLTPQVSTDGGTNWVNTAFFDPATGHIYQQLNATFPAAYATGQIYGIKMVPGASHARVTVSAYTSGSIIGALRATTTQIDPLYAPTSTTYSALYQLAATSSIALSVTALGASTFNTATIFHAATALRQIRIKRVEVLLSGNSAAALVNARLVALTNATTPATGNPAITPQQHRTSSPAAEATCLALPTTQGTAGGVINAVEFNLGIVTASTTMMDPAHVVVLYSDTESQNGEPLIVPALTAGGYAVQVGASASTVIKATVRIVFTEE